MGRARAKAPSEKQDAQGPAKQEVLAPGRAEGSWEEVLRQRRRLLSDGRQGAFSFFTFIFLNFPHSYLAHGLFLYD